MVSLIVCTITATYSREEVFSFCYMLLIKNVASLSSQIKTKLSWMISKTTIRLMLRLNVMMLKMNVVKMLLLLQIATFNMILC